MPAITLSWPTFAPAEFRGGAVTVGNFDGVHLGHRALIAAARALAPATGPTVAVTFDPPPLTVLNPSATKPPLVTLEDKVSLLLKAGATHVVTLKADPSLLALSPEAFFEDVLRDQFGAKAVVEGYDFRFARGRSGTTAMLRQLCEAGGIGFQEVPPQEFHGEVVSSSRIRMLLNTGNVVGAKALLGREYTISGMVVTGAKRGRQLGFPTANLENTPTLVPGNGVYAVRVRVNELDVAGAANVGPNPTFGEEARKLEVHLIDYQGDLYGENLTVAFVEKLRDTVVFPGIEALKAQLLLDVANARLAVANRMAKPPEELP